MVMGYVVGISLAQEMFDPDVISRKRQRRTKKSAEQPKYAGNHSTERTGMD